MVYYFVIAEDGTRYGPADIDTLVAWTREGRLVESTALVERGTERNLRADQITALEAEFRRMRGQPAAVTIERGESSGAARGEPATMTHPGSRGATPGRFASAPGAPPPVPGDYHQFNSPDGGARMRHVPTMQYAETGPLSHRSKLAAGLLGIFLGGLGVHRFYLGYTAIGVVQLILTICTCGASSVWGLIEGILCLTGHIRDVDGRPLRD